jgi:hypothetical protein
MTVLEGMTQIRLASPGAFFKWCSRSCSWRLPTGPIALVPGKLQYVVAAIDGARDRGGAVIARAA